MKRYSVYAEEDDDYDVVTVQVESDDGDWVLHSEAQAEIDRLKAENAELLAALEEMAAQHFCGCKHPSCKNCERDALCGSAIAKARGES